MKLLEKGGEGEDVHKESQVKSLTHKRLLFWKVDVDQCYGSWAGFLKGIATKVSHSLTLGA